MDHRPKDPQLDDPRRQDDRELNALDLLGQAFAYMVPQDISLEALLDRMERGR